ncbi:MAG: hypothetical protein OD918_12055 [Gammaproteobacteria bacterium]
MNGILEKILLAKAGEIAQLVRARPLAALHGAVETATADGRGHALLKNFPELPQPAQ